MIDRRRFLLVAASAVSPLALAQVQKPVRVGVLFSDNPVLSKKRMDGFVRGMAELGFSTSRNLELVLRWANGDLSRLDALAAELVKINVDLIFAPNTVGAAAAQRATTSIPIVFAVPPDPVGSGLVKSMARPGSNLTGTCSVATEISAKRLQILKEGFPKLSRVAVLTSPEPVVSAHYNETQRAAQSLGLDVMAFPLAHKDELGKMSQAIREWRADCVCVIQSSTNFANRKAVAELAIRNRLPGIFPNEDYAEAGGLMSYGADFVELHRRAASYVQKILNGAKPADLPVEQPTTFELVINLKSARAMRIGIPPGLLARADKLIE